MPCRQIKGNMTRLMASRAVAQRIRLGTFLYLGGVLRIDYVFGDNFTGVRYYIPADDLSDHRPSSPIWAQSGDVVCSRRCGLFLAMVKVRSNLRPPSVLNGPVLLRCGA